MSFTVGGSTPQLTFADATVQNTAALPLTGGSVSADITVNSITVGRGAGAVSTNTAVGGGFAALGQNSTGTYNAGFGYNAGYTNLTGSYNSYFGAQAGNGNVGSQSYSTGLGAYALSNISTGANNTAVGAYALQANTTGSNNTAVGYQAGYSQATGASTPQYNTYLGHSSGYSNTTASGAVFAGFQAGYYSTGAYNCFLGYGSGSLVTTGSKNTILGAYSGNQGGLDIRTLNNFIVLSDGDGNPTGVRNNNDIWYFGTGSTSGSGNIVYAGQATSGGGPCATGATGTYGAYTVQWYAGSNSQIKGGTTYSTYTVTAGGSTGGVSLTSGATAWTSASDERLKDIIEPITDAAAKVSTLRAVIGKYKTDEEGTRRSFLIAQDVQAVLPEAVTEGRNSKEDETEYLQVAYTEVIPLLVAAIKELSAQVTALQAKVGV